MPIPSTASPEVKKWKCVVDLLQASGVYPTSYFMERWIQDMRIHQQNYWTKKANLFCLQEQKSSKSTLLISKEEAIGVCMALAVTLPSKSDALVLWDKYGWNCILAGLMQEDKKKKNLPDSRMDL